MNTDANKPRVIQLHPKARTEELNVAEMDVSNPTDKTQILFNTAKMHANREVTIFREATEKYLATIEDTVLFNGLSASLRSTLMDIVLDKAISPVVYGHRPAGMSEEDFKAFRSMIFAALIKRYVKKEDSNE